MAHGSGEGIGGIEVFFLQRGAEQALQHGRYLFLLGIAIAGYGLFDRLGGVFRYFQSFGNRCGYGYALCASELEHRLGVFAVERSFDGHCGGMVEVYEALQAFENAL